MNYYIPYMHKRYASYSWRADNELTMPRIADYFLNCVIYLYPSLEAAQESKNVGGSGFILGVRSKTHPEVFYTYAVTNAHVINGGCPVIRLNRKDGTLDYIVKSDTEWTRHPNLDDLAISPIVLDQEKHKIDFWISDEMFLDKEKIKELDIGIGDEVFIAGRFQLVSGKLQNNPTLRFGNIAQMPNEPILRPDGIDQESYLVECHSISGFSGSPVFVTIPPFAHRPNSDSISSTWHKLFLGIDWSHLPVIEYVEKKDKSSNKWVDNPDLRVEGNSAMMGVIPAWKLRELIDLPEFMNARDERDKTREKQKKATTPEDTAKFDELTLTEEEFANALKKVSRKIKPSKPAPSKPKT